MHPTRAAVLAAVERRPEASLRAIGDEVGVSHARVHQVLLSEGHPPRGWRGQRGPRRPRPTCARDGCDEPTPRTNRKYCSRKCFAIARCSVNGRTAYEMRASGHTWKAISRKLGYSFADIKGTVARTAAVRYAARHGLAWPPRPR